MNGQVSAVYCEVSGELNLLKNEAHWAFYLWMNRTRTTVARSMTLITYFRSNPNDLLEKI